MSKFKFFLLHLILVFPLIIYSAPSINTGKTESIILTKAFVKETGKMSYFWAWPMLNMHNRYLSSSKNTQTGLQNGTVAAAPLNYLAMFHDYVDPAGRLVACPNQDVVYGQSMLSLDKDAVIIQVPDFEGRFWVYQLVNQRTDSIAELGSMYNSKPGFYMIVGSNWKGTVPKEVIKVFHSDTNIVFGIPRIFMNDTQEDKKNVQKYTNQIVFYPLSEFNGKMKTENWAELPIIPGMKAGNSEIQWVDPNKFSDELPEILKEVPPLAGEEGMYTNMQTV